MDLDLYDEFGNYVGPEGGNAPAPPVPTSTSTSASARQHRDEDDEDDDAAADGVSLDEDADADMRPTSTAVVLHEDKTYYASAESVFGPGVEVRVETEPEPDESVAPTSAPLISGLRSKRKHAPKPDTASYGPEFGEFLMRSRFVRNVAFVGALHHGKTSLVDALIERSSAQPFDARAPRPRAQDSRADEKARGISIKTKPVQVAVGDSVGKSVWVSAMDTPGHTHFADEVAAALRLVDGAVVVVCAVEGVQAGTERAIRQVAEAGITSVAVCINKVDRLIHELKLPPGDAFHKLRTVLDNVNAVLERHNLPTVSPTEEGQVVFASAAHGWVVSTHSMATLAVELHPPSSSSSSTPTNTNIKNNSNKITDSATLARKLARRCWGEVFYDPGTGAFHPSRRDKSTPRAFERFVLEPIYKIYAHVLGAEPEDAAAVLKRGFGVSLSRAELAMDALPLLRVALRKCLGAAGALVDCVRDAVPDPTRAAVSRTERQAWPLSRALAQASAPESLAQRDAALEALRRCDPGGDLIVVVTKLLAADDNASDDEDEDTEEGSLEHRFRAVGRVLSGTVVEGQSVTVYPDAFVEDEEPATAIVTAVRVYQGGGRPARRVPNVGVPAGNLVVLSGVDLHVGKTATLVASSSSSVGGRKVSAAAPPPLQLPLFAPLRPGKEAHAWLRLAIEPLKPVELPKVVAGLRAVQKSFPACRAVVEESGEHVVLGTGELYMDCVMHDLRERFARGVEVRVADPFVTLSETVADTSTMRCFADTQQGGHRVVMVASPLEEKLVGALEAGSVPLPGGTPLERVLRAEFGYDVLAARSVWAFGPDERYGPNALLEETLLDGEDERATLERAKDAVVQGFRWAAREGPLCDEPVRGVKWKLMDATLHASSLQRGTGHQLIASTRRASFAAMLTATPRLAEPTLKVDALLSSDAHGTLRRLLRQRRGDVVSETRVPGTPLSRVVGFVPGLDSFGLETDARVASRGRVFLETSFDAWTLAPGDPLDETAVLRPLEPSPPEYLARELVVKTRRRKGLPETVKASDWFDPEQLLELMRAEMGGGGEEAEAAEE